MKFLLVTIDLPREMYTIETVPTLGQRLATGLKVLTIVLLSLSFAFSPGGVSKTIFRTLQGVTESVSKTVTETVVKIVTAPFLPHYPALA